MGAECLPDGSFTLTESTVMSPFGAQALADGEFTFTPALVAKFNASFWGCGSLNGGPCGSIITYYKMIARDPDCISLTYVSWVVLDQPDVDGSMYTGVRCGTSALQDIAIEAKWVIPQ
jgi:hypothetical protein